jgi:hypothetical protein
MNAFRYETACLIATDPRLASLSTQFTIGSARLAEIGSSGWIGTFAPDFCAI